MYLVILFYLVFDVLLCCSFELDRWETYAVLRMWTSRYMGAEGVRERMRSSSPASTDGETERAGVPEDNLEGGGEGGAA